MCTRYLPLVTSHYQTKGRPALSLWPITSSAKCNFTEYIVHRVTKYLPRHNRISEHISYIRTNREATGEHFNDPGHSLSDMKVSINEKVNSQDPLYRKER